MRYLTTLILFLSLNAWGMNAEEAAVMKLQGIQRALEAMSLTGSAPKCSFESGKACDFFNMCEPLNANRKQIYVYQDSSGRKLINYNLLYLQDNVEGCLSVHGKAKKYETIADQDPFATPSLLVGPDGKKYDKVFAQEDARAKRIGQDVQQRMVNVLKSRRNSKNAKYIDNMIKRVEKVQWTSFRPKSEEEFLEEGCVLPNAKYIPSGNKMQLCPQLLGMPDMVLMSVIAHELGHSIDSCFSSLALVNDSGGQESLKDSKWATEKFVLDPIPASKNPFAEAIQCLQKPQSMGLKLRTNADKRADLENYIAGLEREGADPDNGELLRLKNTVRDYEDGQEENLCAENDGDDQAHFMQEAFADWMSAQIMSGKLAEEKDPAKAQKQAFEAQLLGLQSECPSYQADQKEMVLKQMKAAGCETVSTEALFSLDQSADSEKHPGWAKRVNKVYLAEPEVQKALKCQPDKGTAACK
ncbi:MAG: hypothetical protein JSU04_13205 [Bdellovibrionales bacterium]|nr:hypothetical protein [Bdellovibrionales bacterium]